MDHADWAHIVISILGYVAVVATLRAKVSEHDRRITELEECEQRRSQDYVPRHEVAGRLDSMQRSLDSLINHFVYRRRAGDDN